MSTPSHQPMLSRGGSAVGNPHTQIRASIRSMETELGAGGGGGGGGSGGRLSLQASRSMAKYGLGGTDPAAAAAAASGGPARGRALSYPQPHDFGDSSRHSDRSGSGPEGGIGDGTTAGGATASTSRHGRPRRKSGG